VPSLYFENIDCKNVLVLAMRLKYRDMCLYGTAGLVAHAACAPTRACRQQGGQGKRITQKMVQQNCKFSLKMK